GIRDGVEEPEAQDVGCRALGDDRRARRARLAVDAERGVQGRGHAVLEHWPALVGELVAHGARPLRVKHRRMVLDFIAVRTGDGIFMTLPTAARIEQGAETDLRREGAVEHRATAVEL